MVDHKIKVLPGESDHSSDHVRHGGNRIVGIVDDHHFCPFKNRLEKSQQAKSALLPPPANSPLPPLEDRSCPVTGLGCGSDSGKR